VDHPHAGQHLVEAAGVALEVEEVTSRGERVARRLAEHHEPVHLDDVARAATTRTA